MWKVSVVAIFCVTVVSASCPRECRCPSDTPRCAAGVSLTLDGCGCCRVCAQQLFDDCSKLQPCDRTKGLECNYGGGYGSAKGICRAKLDGRPCEYNKKIYQNGEIFRPNCKHQCTCMDGAVGCVSLCPRVVIVPKMGCAKPRRMKVPGGCCDQLLCPEESPAGKKRMKKHRKDNRVSENDPTEGNELSPEWTGGSKSLPVFTSGPLAHILVAGVQCVPQTTAWSPCSKSCGTGVSTRVTNSNSQCKLTKETRICQIRSCSQMNRMKSGRECNHTEKARRPVKLSHAGCRSLRKFQPKYCGSCSDGRCCRPHRTQTSSVRFRCQNGKIISRMVMMIESCRCHQNCPGVQKKTAAHYRFIKDIRKLRM